MSFDFQLDTCYAPKLINNNAFGLCDIRTEAQKQAEKKAEDEKKAAQAIIDENNKKKEEEKAKVDKVKAEKEKNTIKTDPASTTTSIDPKEVSVVDKDGNTVKKSVVSGLEKISAINTGGNFAVKIIHELVFKPFCKDVGGMPELGYYSNKEDCLEEAFKYSSSDDSNNRDPDLKYTEKNSAFLNLSQRASSVQVQTTKGSFAFFTNLLIYIMPVALVAFIYKVVSEKQPLFSVIPNLFLVFSSSILITTICQITNTLASAILGFAYKLGPFSNSGGSNGIVPFIVSKSFESGDTEFASSSFKRAIEICGQSIYRGLGQTYEPDLFLPNLQFYIFVIFAWTAFSLFFSLIINNLLLQVLYVMSPIISLFFVLQETKSFMAFWATWFECLIRQILFVIVISIMTNVLITSDLFNTSTGSIGVMARWIMVLVITPAIMDRLVRILVTFAEGGSSSVMREAGQNFQSATNSFSLMRSNLGGTPVMPKNLPSSQQLPSHNPAQNLDKQIIDRMKESGAQKNN
jgi:hypothetical protein